MLIAITFDDDNGQAAFLAWAAVRLLTYYRGEQANVIIVPSDVNSVYASFAEIFDWMCAHNVSGGIYIQVKGQTMG